MPDRVWYYASGGQQRGPVKTAELKQLATAGDLKPDDLVWCDGMPNWSPATTVKGLFPTDAAQAADASAAPTGTGPIAHEETSSHGHPPAAEHQYREQMQTAREFATQASREAAGAFKTLMVDPIGGLASCFSKLGNRRAMQVGTVFIVVAVALYSLAALLSFGGIDVLGLSKARFAFLTLISAVVAVAAMVGVSYAFRSWVSRTASYHADLFIIGAALMPIALAKFLSSLLAANAIVALIGGALLVFGGVFSLLMLFNGQITIARHSERTGTLATACIASAGALASGLMMWLFG